MLLGNTRDPIPEAGQLQHSYPVHTSSGLCFCACWVIEVFFKSCLSLYISSSSLTRRSENTTTVHQVLFITVKQALLCLVLEKYKGDSCHSTQLDLPAVNSLSSFICMCPISQSRTCHYTKINNGAGKTGTVALQPKISGHERLIAIYGNSATLYYEYLHFKSSELLTFIHTVILTTAL